MPKSQMVVLVKFSEFQITISKILSNVLTIVRLKFLQIFKRISAIRQLISQKISVQILKQYTHIIVTVKLIYFQFIKHFFPLFCSCHLLEDSMPLLHHVDDVIK